MKLNKIDELEKLEKQVSETQKLLELKGNNEKLLEDLTFQRNILAFLSLLLLFGLVWSYFFKNNASDGLNVSYLENENLTLIDIDSLKYFKNNEVNINKTDTIVDYSNQKVLYRIQLGNFKDFKLTSEDLIESSDIDDRYNNNKFCVGNFTKYAEAKDLKNNLRNLGYKDCFITIQSYGKSIDINKALVLSEETQFIIK